MEHNTPLWSKQHFHDLVQDCGNSIANILELLLSFTKSLIRMLK